MNRNFICTPTDLSNFRSKFYEFRATVPRHKDKTLFEVIEFSIHLQKTKLEDYGLTFDEITQYWADRSLKYSSIDSLHFFYHHAMWQILDGHYKGLLNLSNVEAAWYEKHLDNCSS